MEDKPKILIIDDEEVVLDSCTQILESGNYHTATATDGASGLKLVQELRPDVVFVDLKMPGLSGLEVLERIHEFDSTVVTIVITGYATVGSAVEAMKQGAYDFIPKPFTPDEFRLITRRGLEKRRLVLETMALKREKEMLREHFAAIVAHELKAPLGAVQQNLYVLKNELSGKLTEAQQGRLERMKTGIDDLLRLIHTWLRAYSTDIEKISESFKPVSVSSIISKAVESVQLHATRKDIEILTAVEEPLKRVHGDEGTLVEALVNLMGNALKYSRVGSRVLVRAKANDDSILILVTDTGVGIAKEDLPFIFDGFRVGKPGPESERGSGLGLAITRRIIEAHYGSITVESELGQGSTFAIRLPGLDNSLHDPLNPEVAGVAQSQSGGVR